MNLSASFEMDEAYFVESFDEWLHAKSRFRRWQRQISGAAILVALLAVLFADLPAYVAVGLFMVGVVEGLEFYWHRSNWVAQRIKARGRESVVIEMHFTKSGIDTKGPTSNGHVSWKGVREIVQTARGVTFRIGDGLSIYVPRRSVTPVDSWHQIAEWAKSDA
jgi:YcxB-like protein